jgi:hypothetical protein
MPGSLHKYAQQVQRFIHDSRMESVDWQNIVDYVNQARRETAMRSQCIRVLPKVSGSIVSIPVPNVSGWVAPVTVTITPPDSPPGTLPYPNGAQATATASLSVSGGHLTGIAVTFGGAGYFQPQAVLTDAAGHTATVTPATTVLNMMAAGQEVYPFAGFDVSGFPGAGQVYAVRSVSIIYSNYRYSLPIYSFSTYQAKIRQYAGGTYQYVPTFGSLFGRGAEGSLYLYPVPSQAYQLEVDCSCLPQDLVDDQSVEAIPDPWTDAVPYYAAHLAMLELQSFNNARFYEDMFSRRLMQMGGYTLPGRAINPYGRP